MEEKEISVEEAEKIVRKRNENMIKACQQELEQIMQKYNCVLVPVVNIEGNRVNSRVVITMKE